MAKDLRPHVRRSATALLLTAALFGASAAFAVLVAPAVALPTTAPAERANGVHDEANLFQPDAVRQAEDVIGQIKQDHGRDLLIETYPAIAGAPNGPGEEQARNRFYTEWMTQRGQALGVRGMMVLIVTDRPHLQIYVGASTQKRFTRADQEELQRRLTDALKQKRYDNALVKTAGFVKDRMDRNAGRVSPPVTRAFSPCEMRLES